MGNLKVLAARKTNRSGVERARVVLWSYSRLVDWGGGGGGYCCVLRLSDLKASTEMKLLSPGEIKRKEVSWTLTKNYIDTFLGPHEIKRREAVLDPQVSPEEIKSREVELSSESWTSFASVVTQHQCYGHCDCAPHSS